MDIPTHATAWNSVSVELVWLSSVLEDIIAERGVSQAQKHKYRVISRIRGS